MAIRLHRYALRAKAHGHTLFKAVATPRNAEPGDFNFVICKQCGCYSQFQLRGLGDLCGGGATDGRSHALFTKACKGEHPTNAAILISRVTMVRDYSDSHFHAAQHFQPAQVAEPLEPAGSLADHGGLAGPSIAERRGHAMDAPDAEDPFELLDMDADEGDDYGPFDGFS